MASPEANAAYRNGLCIDCRVVRYSAGRTRCNECFDKFEKERRGEIWAMETEQETA